MADLAKLVDDLSSLSVLEAAELSKMLEEKWGVSAAAAALAAIPDDEERLVLATGRYIGEGFDDARLDTLFLALPVSWKGTLAQYTGRLHRLHPAKSEVRIFDYVDRAVPMLAAMFEKRLRAYRAIGYIHHESLLGFERQEEEPTIEYDEETRYDGDDVRQPE